MLTLATLKFLVAGSFLGLAAGISPGPLLALVIAQSLKHGRKEGIKVAFAPLIADIPIVILTVFILRTIARFNLILSLISFAGAIFAAFLGWESFRSKGLPVSNQAAGIDSLRKGVIAGSLNPHPYLFWATIGAPYLIRAAALNALAPVLFVTGFYLFLVGSKIVIAILTARSRKLLEPKVYLIVMKILGAVMLILAALFVYDGVKYLN
jgi:threonine/homoserine/homoserine lactone efflux protein